VNSTIYLVLFVLTVDCVKGFFTPLAFVPESISFSIYRFTLDLSTKFLELPASLKHPLSTTL
jgi:hypothetical protein